MHFRIGGNILYHSRILFCDISHIITENKYEQYINSSAVVGKNRIGFGIIILQSFLRVIRIIRVDNIPLYVRISAIHADICEEGYGKHAKENDCKLREQYPNIDEQQSECKAGKEGRQITLYAERGKYQCIFEHLPYRHVAGHELDIDIKAHDVIHGGEEDRSVIKHEHHEAVACICVISDKIIPEQKYYQEIDYPDGEPLFKIALYCIEVIAPGFGMRTVADVADVVYQTDSGKPEGENERGGEPAQHLGSRRNDRKRYRNAILCKKRRRKRRDTAACCIKCRGLRIKRIARSDGFVIEEAGDSEKSDKRKNIY